MLMKTQDIGYVLQKVQSEKKVWPCLSYVQSLSLTTPSPLLPSPPPSLCGLLVTKNFLLQKIEKLTALLHSLDNQPSNKHVYYVEDRFEFPDVCNIDE